MAENRGAADCVCGRAGRVVDVASRGSFLEPSNIVRVLRQITYNCILGIGQTFVIITAGIDLLGRLARRTDRRGRGAFCQLRPL